MNSKKKKEIKYSIGFLTKSFGPKKFIFTNYLGYYLQSITCIKKCLINEYYYSPTDTCLGCSSAISRCTSCFLNSDNSVNCSRCEDGYFLKLEFGGSTIKCVSACLTSEISISGQCFTCSSLFPSCLTCGKNGNNAYECTSCTPNMVLSSMKDSCS